MDGVHDMGGMQGFGIAVWPGSEAPIHDAWELRVFALAMTCGTEGLTGEPGLRATIETMPAERYLASGYYERWLWATEQGLLAKGTIAPGEIDAWVERIRAGESVPVTYDSVRRTRVLDDLRAPYPFPEAARPRFASGDRVRVRRMRPTGHNRCPRYVRGASGVVERVQGEDHLPGAPSGGPREAVYGVAFASEELWGANAERAWTVRIDLWESYLEPWEGEP